MGKRLIEQKKAEGNPVEDAGEEAVVSEVVSDKMMLYHNNALIML